MFSHINKLRNIFPQTLIYTRGHKKELVVETSLEDFIPVITFLKKSTLTQYEVLRDRSAVDNPEVSQRFEVYVSLLSLRNASRILVTVKLTERESLLTLTSLYPAAGWFEREIWDRFGVIFRGNPDLRRRLTDYGFKGHPLRKDFPLTGYVEVRYDATTKRIQYGEVKLAQEFRLFNITSPWALSKKLFVVLVAQW